MECPILVWMLTFNREFSVEEYDQCYQTMKTCVAHANVPYQPHSKESTLKVISYLMPLVMMRHRRVSRHRWRDQTTDNGKHWIEMEHDQPLPHHQRVRSMIGYHIAHNTNLVGMIMTQGPQHHVVNLGLAMQPIATEPPGMSVSAYLESQYHKLTASEIESLSGPTDRANESRDETILRRLCMLLSLKQAYIRAIGQPLGFDYTRLEFDIPNEHVVGDGRPLFGWEFRVWHAFIEVLRPDGTTEEQCYQCASAFFRGIHNVRFVHQTDAKELESWVQFLTPDQLMAVMPKLTD